MPVYEFHCRRCDKEFAAVMHVDDHDRHVAECPGCHRDDEVDRRLSTFTPVTSHKSAGI
jgi:putative FmdB family regulatory protein